MNKKEIKRRIEEHIKWIDWRVSGKIEKQKGVKLRLSNDSIKNTDFSGQDFGCAEFSKVDLTGVSFLNANLSGTIFERCNLTHVNFEGCNMPKANFFCCNLSNVSFQNARCYKCEFDENTMKDISFKSTNLQYADISESVLQNIDFTMANCYFFLIHSCVVLSCFGKRVKNIDSAIIENTYFESENKQAELISSFKYMINYKKN